MMSRPTARSWELLKRVGRYLKGRPRLVWKYNWQSPVDVVDVHSDANWAGCRESRKSSSGGTIAIGGHLIRAYSKTQAVIAKSSGESELYAVVRASSEALGILTLLKDFGCPEMRASVGMDASAAIGIVQRQGISKSGMWKWMFSGSKNNKRDAYFRYEKCQGRGTHRTWARRTLL